ncbi:hypothetical protein CAP47_05375 [Psychroflexus sp. S27]|uniref:PepSY-like domain-containing protein n=1 Tax=Psychroflexus sp. S27 TaxID=1982757 RepID=UPI000C2A4061|nr:PepSY-like domain-containing protein [Psychroflexus sp. S27]PJX23661.1 hypothetical protein CAP47_05375 [Psychroflexus sp. S27]
MKTMKPMLGLFVAAFAFYSCSSDDDASPQPPMAKSSLTIKAQSGLNGTAEKITNAASDVEINQFMINLSEIEFEFADNDQNQVFSVGAMDDEDDLAYEDLPEEIKSYLDDNYPEDAFCKGELEDDGPYMYEVELESGLELYFKADFTLYATEASDEPCHESDQGGNSWGSQDDLELAGPFELDLSQGEVTVADVEIPVGVYEEVEFEMDINKEPASDLYQKSIMITGSISGKPFTFYHTFEEEFEIDYEDAGQNLVIEEGGDATVVFNFDLQAVVNTVDLSSAQDLNNDGQIDISPIDEDGNNALAHQIKNAIVEYAELLDD